MSKTTNQYGRTWGRGIRPWILIPKYLAVSLLLGGLASVLVLALCSSGQGTANQDQARQLIRTLFRFLIIPATISSILLGIFLLLQHPRPFLRMRWLILKLILVALITPLSHALLSRAIHHQIGMGPFLKYPACALTGFVLISILGRLKPRLGQAYK